MNGKEVMSTTTSNVAEYIDGLRKLADIIEADPGIVVVPDYTLNLFADSAETMADLVRRIGGTWEKRSDDNYFTLSRQLTGDRYCGVAIEINGRHERVCERVITGTRTVEVPDPVAVAQIPLVSIEENIVEWVCPESLLRSTERTS